MPLIIELPDEELVGFSEPAKNKLQEAAREFAAAIVVEANRIEAGRNEARDVPEVTQVMVSDAVAFHKRGNSPPKKSIGLKLLQGVGSALSLVAGFMYDKEAIREPLYLIMFVLVIALTVVVNTISLMKE